MQCDRCCIYFGSYGTKYYDSENSDIDIAWFTNKEIDLITRIKVGEILEDLLEMKVDLVVVNKNSVEHLLYNIFETGECILVGSDEFGEVDLTCFPDVYKKFNNIKVGNIIKIFGRVEKRYDKYQVIINNISILE